MPMESDYHTMNGWALERLEHIPAEGETFSDDLFTVTVEQVDDQKVTKMLVRIGASSSAQGE